LQVTRISLPRNQPDADGNHLVFTKDERIQAKGMLYAHLCFPPFAAVMQRTRT
jgi:hypothetical protein